MAGNCLFGVNAASNPRLAASFAALISFASKPAAEDLAVSDLRLASPWLAAWEFARSPAAAEESRLLGNWQINSRRGLAAGEGFVSSSSMRPAIRAGQPEVCPFLFGAERKPAGEDLALGMRGNKMQICAFGCMPWFPSLRNTRLCLLCLPWPSSSSTATAKGNNVAAKPPQQLRSRWHLCQRCGENDFLSFSRAVYDFGNEVF